MSVKVLVVDDSGFFRKRVCEILGTVPDVEVVGTASNGREAIDMVKKFRPDVVTMDYEMPVMDGVTAVRHIMSECPTSILMFSSLTYEGARVTLDALEAGAVDFLPKNFEDIARDATKMQEVLKNRILALAKPGNLRAAASRPATAERISPPSTPSARSPLPSSDRRSPGAERAPLRPATAAPRADKAPAGTADKKPIKHPVDLLIIGTSTGGPVALQKVLTKLPANLPVPVLIVQHMPASFTPAFAERLNSLSQLKVKHASDGDYLRRGEVLIAPGGKQMLVSGKGSGLHVNIMDGDERLTYKPSVDITFGSAAKSLPGKVLAVVLTGMGADGREGARLLKRTGSTVWTQSAKTCVIYGMPMAVDKAGYSDGSFDLDDIAERIVSGIM